jgi:diacylglycerol kinase
VSDPRAVELPARVAPDPPAPEPHAPLAPLPEDRRGAPTLGPRRLLRSFAAAFAGLGHLLRHEPNAQIHAALALVATALGIWLGLTPPEWALLATLFGLVIGLEAMNTAIEGLSDLAMPAQDPRVRTIKDLAAAGVLAGALGAAGAGLCLFGPRLVHLLLG